MPYHAPPPPDLDDVDRRLIGHLIADGRATYTSLAPIVGLSHTAVRARVQRLLDEDVVTVTARIDPRSLGMGVFGFALLGIDRPAFEITRDLDAIPEVVFAAAMTGKWAFILELRCRDTDHLLETLDRVRAVDGVEDFDSLTALHYFKQGWAEIAAEVFGEDIPLRATNPVPSRRTLDEVDRRLIGELIADGRASYSDLATAIGLSQTAVRARVQRLLDESIVVIEAYASAASMGIGSFAAAMISVTGDVREVAERLCGLPEFTLIAATGGRYDLLCEVWCRDNRHLLESLDEIRAMPGVRTCESGTFLQVVKQAYRLGGDNGA